MKAVSLKSTSSGIVMTRVCHQILQLTMSAEIIKSVLKFVQIAIARSIMSAEIIKICPEISANAAGHYRCQLKF